MLETYGIGFILSDWLEVSDENKVIVHFKSEYLSNWVQPGDEIYDDQIYSFGDFCKISEIPDIEDNLTSSIESEILVKKYLWDYSNLSYGTLYALYQDSSQADLNKFLLSRKFPGVGLKELEQVSDTELVVHDSTIGPSGTDLIFLYPHETGYMGTFKTIFTRCKLANFADVLENVCSQIQKYELLAFEERDSLYWYSGNIIEERNCYGDLQFNSYADLLASEQAVDDSGEALVLKPKYRQIDCMQEDIQKFLYTHKNFIKLAKSQLMKIPNIESAVGQTETAEEYLQEELYGNSSDYVTPQEYYGNLNISYDGDIENVFEDIGDDRNWFWLDTIKNWCMYFEENNILTLKCWNGKNGWDSIVDILDNMFAKNLDILATKYLYSPKFFNVGSTYPLNWSVYAPIRYRNHSVAAVYYQNLILDFDTKDKNYNSIFQSLHDSKLYTDTQERNALSNSDISTGRTNNNEPIKHQQFMNNSILAIPTQYCPCLMKLANGKLAISVVFHSRGNGFGAPSSDGTDTTLTISAPTANKRCRDIFGDGSTKTIIDDWKKYYVSDFTEEIKSEIYTNTSDTINSAPNLIKNLVSDKINSIRILAKRPNPTTGSIRQSDYLERWDK